MTDLTKKESGVHNCNENCGKSFQILKDSISKAPVPFETDRLNNFRGHIYACERADGETLTQLYEYQKDQIELLSKKVFAEKFANAPNDIEVLGLIMFPERFRCRNEGLDFEIFTDIRFLETFLLINIEQKRG